MDQLSRRNLLKAGGALGVVGAVTAVSGISPAWAWSTRRSVIGGDLQTVPPENVWDPEADAVVHRLFREEGITRIERVYRIQALGRMSSRQPDHPSSVIVDGSRRPRTKSGRLIAAHRSQLLGRVDQGQINSDSRR